jgi:heme/copper-type cytochrome/quinol oxidase subunit 2
MPINKTNLITTKKGEVVDVTKLNARQVCKLAREVDDLDAFESLEHIRSVYIGTAPNVKLHYPEPFIASPSFIHSDIGFLHILQYQYWLWFIFIFLICFFFISFLCVARWCSNRNQPRRETRGVSRSKCGDLITSTVPVAWAISIIVSESTDPSDYNEGSGTGELMVGIRGYQWGWQYYYPKYADLNHNIHSNYSTYVGRSLQYNSVTGRSLKNNNVWKFYQQKSDNALITPAHLLIIPTDNSKVLKFMRFNEIGTDLLKASTAFKRVRQHSKVYTTNLVHTPTVLTKKYKQLQSLYLTESDLINSHRYGIDRQHGFTSRSAYSYLGSTFLDRSSMNKFLKYNYQYNVEKAKTNLFDNRSRYWSKKNTSNSNVATLNNLRLLLMDTNTYNSKMLHLLNTYPNLPKEIGDNTDKKMHTYPLRKLLNDKVTRNVLNNQKSILNNLTTGVTASTGSSFFKSNVWNPSTTFKKKFFLKTKASKMYNPEKSRWLHLSPTVKGSNHQISLGLNSLDSNMTKLNSNSSTTNPSYFYSIQKTGWNDLTSFNKLISNRLHYGSDVAPTISSNPYLSRVDFDSPHKFELMPHYTESMFPKDVTAARNSKVAALALEAKTKVMRPFSFDLRRYPSYIGFSSQDKDGTTKDMYHRTFAFTSGKVAFHTHGERSTSPATPLRTYWKTLYRHSNFDLRLNQALKSSASAEAFPYPKLIQYKLFARRQRANYVRSYPVFWDAYYGTSDNLEYTENASRNAKRFEFRDNYWRGYFLRFTEWIYHWGWKKALTQRGILGEPTLQDLSLAGKAYSNNIEWDTSIISSSKLNMRHFGIFPNTVKFGDMDSTYVDRKSLSLFLRNQAAIVVNTASNVNYPRSYWSVLNHYRLGFFDDFSLVQDLTCPKTLLNPTSHNEVRSLGNTLATDRPATKDLFRFTNPLRLRRTARDSGKQFVTFQKVFRLFFEEGRGKNRLTNLGNVKVNQVFLFGKPEPLRQMLGKNKESFYNTTYTTKNAFTVFNDLLTSSESLNFPFYDFPFLLAESSDPARGIWFDGYSRYVKREIAGASPLRFSTTGVPYFRKHFDFTEEASLEYKLSENYLTRLTRARRNAVPTWQHSPYGFHLKNTWSQDFNPIASCFARTYSPARLFCLVDCVWTKWRFSQTVTDEFTPTFSHSHKSNWRPYASVQSYYHNVSALSDILTRREHLFRQHFEKRNKLLRLPLALAATPQNPLLEEIKSTFMLVDPITFSSSYSRDFYISSQQYFNYLLYKEWLIYLDKTIVHLPINTKLLNDYLFFYFIGGTLTDDIGKTSELYKNQHRPLRKGVYNMIRLQSNGAVAMPIQTRLHILAHSRDVIHSWAIPSAGIKIDCIPGYTSHRITSFTNPGIYWGQCMEICGRFHHWMPIVVYFMRRDLFFLWCTHFSCGKKTKNMWGINDRQFTDYLKFASYDQTTWLTELSRGL